MPKPRYPDVEEWLLSLRPGDQVYTRRDRIGWYRFVNATVNPNWINLAEHSLGYHTDFQGAPLLHAYRVTTGREPIRVRPPSRPPTLLRQKPLPIVRVPAPPLRPLRVQAAAVYRCFDSANRLLYVGYSADPPARLRTHSKSATWWPLVDYRTLEWFPTTAEAAHAEHQAILIECPIYNKAGQTQRYASPIRR
jgi:predicted GIY-YIG superfamily endonuclease